MKDLKTDKSHDLVVVRHSASDILQCHIKYKIVYGIVGIVGILCIYFSDHLSERLYGGDRKTNMVENRDSRAGLR